MTVSQVTVTVPNKEMPPGTGVVVAGCGVAGAGGDGGPALEARLGFPADVCAGPSGEVLIADHANHRVRRVEASGVISTVAGDGLRGYAGDAGEATSARLGFPAAVALDSGGNLFIADEMNHRVLRVGPVGVISTVAGDGSRGAGGDGGPATEAQLSSPCGIAVTGAGLCYIVDGGNRQVRRVGADGVISTVLTGRSDRARTEQGPAVAGEPFAPADVATDASGAVYVADIGGRRVLRLDERGGLSVIAGPAGGEPAPGVVVGWEAPCAVAVDRAGAVYAADLNAHAVWRIADGAARVIAGADAGAAAAPGEGGPVAGVSLAYPCGLAVDDAGQWLYIADNMNHRVEAIRLPDPGKGDAGQPGPVLSVAQEGGLEVEPGQGDLLHVRVSCEGVWDPGPVAHHFTAPSGFAFEPPVTCSYYRADRTVAEGETLTVVLRDEGRRMEVTGRPRLNTGPDKAGVLVYALPVRARREAAAGRFKDGRAVIAGHEGVRLKATVLTAGEG
ncbi:serine/threonine protein kinase [Streptomyces sp. NPDC003038]|uniref:NHL domain-containing protein n=1 Tax=unclassified Streptomyces TaxID=2593676 RepID=UPI0033A89894